MVFVVRRPPRKIHVTRILGTNKDGDVLTDTWADVERIDGWSYIVGMSLAEFNKAQMQNVDIRTKTNSHLRWRDNPDNKGGSDGGYQEETDNREDFNDTPRQTITLKICAPDTEDFENPEEWIPIRVIKKIQLRGAFDRGMHTNYLFKTNPSNPAYQESRRLVEYRRIYHYDTAVDDRVEKAFDDDPERKAYVIKDVDYQKDDETKDDGQYVEVELVKQIRTKNAKHHDSNGTTQEEWLHLKYEYLMEESEEAKLERPLGPNDRNPPYRLDPFQNIVNINWGGQAVKFYDKDK